MKDIFFSFLIALALGSMLNGGIPGVNFMGGPGAAGSQPPDGQQAQAAATAGMDLVQDIDEGSFQGYVLDANEPVLVEFYTDNCPHCLKMAPVLGTLALKGQSIVRVCKVNASNNQSLADRYGVAGVPAFVLFDKGQVRDSVSGAMEGSEIRAWLARFDVKVPSFDEAGT